MTDRERRIDLIKKAEKQELLDFFTADLDEAIDMSGGKIDYSKINEKHFEDVFQGGINNG